MRWNQTIASVHELALRDDEVALKNFLVILDQDIFTSHTSALYDTLVSPLYGYELVLLVIFQVDGPKHGLQNISDLTLFPKLLRISCGLFVFEIFASFQQTSANDLGTA